MYDDLGTFEQFISNYSIFHYLTDIRRFIIIADITPLDKVTDQLGYIVAREIYTKLREVIKLAKFFHDYELKIETEGERAGVKYEDSEFAFAVYFDSNHIYLIREGSSLKYFHNWYSAIMRSIPDIFTYVTSILTDKFRTEIEILRASYQFEFILYNIVFDGTIERGVKNWEIMPKLLRGYPDDQGIITDAEDVRKSMARVDVRMTRWLGEDPENRRVVRYIVEAPGNQGGASLWFNFQYGGEPYRDPITGQREGFSSTNFFNQSGKAYVMFLRDNAIRGFLAELMKNHRFKTTAGPLP